MNPIDQAFLNAYAKTKSAPKPSNVADAIPSTPIRDPQAKRVLRADRPEASVQAPAPHFATDPIPVPSLASTLRSPSMVVASIAPTSDPVPAPKVQPILHVRIDRESPAPTVAPIPGPTSKTVRPLSFTDSTRSPDEDPNLRRRTLTSYLQQSRREAGQASMSVAPTVQPPRPIPPSPSVVSQSSTRPTAPNTSTASRDRVAPVMDAAAPPLIREPAKRPAVATRWSHANVNDATSMRIDPPQTIHPPVTRPAEINPWQATTVERNVKAVASSASTVAKTINPIPSKAADFLPQKTGVSSPLPERVADRHHFDAVVPTPHSSADAGPVARAADPLPTSPSIKPDAVPAKSSRLPQPQVTESLEKVSLPIQALWEVDQFFWPATVESLIASQSDAFHEIGLHFQRVHSKGLWVLSVTGGERGVGRSTVAMCLAKTIAQAGLRVALMDGDYECPSLVDQFNLAVDHGWQDCLTKNVPLDEVIVHSLQDNVALLPLTESIAPSLLSAYAPRINKLMKRLTQAYDFVIVDANRINQKNPRLLGTGTDAVLDAALVIIDAELSLRQRVDSAIELIREQGIQSIGLAENFHAGIGG